MARRRSKMIPTALAVVVSLAQGTSACSSSSSPAVTPPPAPCVMRLDADPAFDLVLAGSETCQGPLRLSLRVATGDPASPTWNDAGQAPLRIEGRWELGPTGATRKVTVSNPGATPVSLVGLEWTAHDALVADRMLHSGYQSWSYTGIESIPDAIPEANGTAAHGGDDENPLGELRGVSWWYAALSGEEGRGLVLGGDGGTVFKTYVAADAKRVRLIQGLTGDATEIAPGASRTLDGVFAALGDVSAGLDAYARHVAAVHPPVVPRKRALGGWGSWNLYYDKPTAALLRDEIGWAKEHLAPAGLTDFLLDDGYEPYWGVWKAGDAFGAELASLNGEQTAAGLVPAVWVAPMYLGVEDPALTAHPDWFVRTSNGQPRVFEQLNGKKVVTLDVSHPDARGSIVSQLTTMWSWGYRTFKLDFLYAGAIEGGRKEAMTSLESYQLWMRTIRDALPDAHLVGCGAPQLPSVGWFDSMRTGPDIAYVTSPVPLYSFYLGQARHTALRGSTDAWWALDPDVILLRGTRIDDVDAWTIVVSGALAGGNYLLGDARQAGDLRAKMALDPEIVALHDGVAARARDLMKQTDLRMFPTPLLDARGDTVVPHLWEKRSADGTHHWLAVFAWQDDPYKTEIDLPKGAVEILAPTSSAPSTTKLIDGRSTIEVPTHGTRIFRW